MEMINRKQQHMTLIEELKNERSSFIPTWRDLNDYLLPRRARFFTSDTNKGDRRNHKIIHTGPVSSVRTLKSGMMAGITSPARPWFKLATPDPELNKFPQVKEWLDLVTRRMQTVFSRSNYYNTKPIVYGDMGVFATSAYAIEEHFDNTIHCTSFPIGSYCLARDQYGRVNTFIYEFRMTCRQMVNMFGQSYGVSGIDWSKFSQQVKDAWDNGNYNRWFDIVRIIQPNDQHDSGKMLSKFKKFSSVTFEYAGDSNGGRYIDIDNGKYLKESGYDYFPVLAPVWERTGEDSYGTSSPGMDVIGDVKQLQTGEKRSLEALEKMIRPPMIAPTSMQNRKTSILPGDTTYVDVREGMQGYRPAHEMNFRFESMEAKQAAVYDRINKGFYADLFLMMAESDRRQITAREIEERHQEKLLALGPVLEQLNTDDLDPSIDITFDIMNRQGLLPVAPQELQGMDLRVEYTSIMSQAQKLIGINTLERFGSFIGGVVQVSPQAMAKINIDKYVDSYADALSMPMGIVRSDDEANSIRDAQAQAQAAQQESEMLAQGAQAARNLSEAKIEGEDDNALNRLIKQAEAGQLVSQQGG